MDANTIKKFREALRNGEVKFTYVKKNGEKRVARGTMKSDLLPKVEPIVAKFDVEVDKWTESENTPKRRKFKVGVTQPEIDEWGADAMDNVVEAAILKKMGCAAEEFSYWPIDMEYDETPRKLAPETVFYFDLDKNEFRSFNESQLFEVELPTK